MHADFDLPKCYEYVRTENNLGGQIWYRTLDPVKKRRQRFFGQKINSFTNINFKNKNKNLSVEEHE